MFGSETLKVYLRRAPERRSDTLVFAFPGYSQPPRFAKSGFAEEYLARSGIDTIHFLSSRNDWYQAPEMQSAIACAARAAESYPRRVSYGSSMGGYAACLYSHWLGASRAIAFSPQFSIRRAIIPAERRWRAEARSISFHFDDMYEMAKATPELLLVHDPTDPDDRHQIGLFRQIRNIAEFQVPFAGHNTLAFFHELKLLASFLQQSIHGDLDRPHFRSRIRSARSGSSLYLAAAALRLANARRLTWARSMLTRYDALPQKRNESVQMANAARARLG